MYRNTIYYPSAALIALSMFVSLPGCGGDDGPKVVQVRGTVTMDGEPLSGVGVSFRPDGSKGNNVPFNPGGSTDESGAYQLTTAAKEGAPEGWYKVVLFAPSAPPGAEMPKSTKPPFNPKYSDPAKSDISIEVVKNAEPGAYDLELSK